MNDWFIVNDLHEFTDKVRAIVFNNFGTWGKEDGQEVSMDSVKDDDIDELNSILSHNESLTIVKSKLRSEKNKKSKKTRYILNDKIFADIISCLNDRIVSNTMSGLVQKGLVESAFDDETNDFIFWIKDDETKDSKENPETD